ncbi:MAG: hypothetical protein ABIK89_27160 [Planctomycetota bacterium]
MTKTHPAIRQSHVAVVFAIAALSGVAVDGGEPAQGYALVGRVQPRHAREIEASSWSVGAETMDRDYTIYAAWKEHLGPLGVKRARIQAGWAKTEKEPGTYDWAWLDEIIPDMVAQGVIGGIEGPSTT